MKFSNINEKIGKNLKEARKNKNFTQLYVQMNAYIDQSHLSKIERGIIQADYNTLKTLSMLYGASLDDIFDLSR